MNKTNKPKPIIKRIGGYLHKIVPIVDSSGNVIHHVAKPFMVEIRPRDIMQIIVAFPSSMSASISDSMK
jgi:hypothetical protein